MKHCEVPLSGASPRFGLSFGDLPNIPIVQLDTWISRVTYQLGQRTPNHKSEVAYGKIWKDVEKYGKIWKILWSNGLSTFLWHRNIADHSRSWRPSTFLCARQARCELSSHRDAIAARRGGAAKITWIHMDGWFMYWWWFMYWLWHNNDIAGNIERLIFFGFRVAH